MPPRSPFRVLPPIALVLVVAAVWLVVDPGGEPAPARPTAETTTTTASQPRRRTYTVRSGDSLSKVAQRYDLTVERLVELNPQVDPQVLVRGQRLRLRD